MTVYADGFILLNFLLDYLLLWGADCLSGAGRSLRLLLGALAGACFSGLCLIPELGFLGKPLCQAAGFFLMVWAGFGFDRLFFRRCLLVGMLALALGGGGYLLRRGGHLNFLTLAAVGVGTALGLRGALRGGCAPPGELMTRVRIRLGDREVTLTALRDTGNSLRDPITGQRVLVAQWDAAEKLLPVPLAREELESPADAMERLQKKAPQLRFRLIPYRTVGSSAGLMLAVRCDQVTAGGQELGKLVAFSPVTFSENGTYQALAGGIGSC